MSTYKGLKSADAEITLDFIKGQAIFDYSLNQYQNGSSDNTCVLHKEGNTINRIFNDLKVPFLGIWFIILCIGTSLLSLLQMVFLRIPKYQYTWQKLLKLWDLFVYGSQEESIIGKQDTKTLTFYLHKNVWFDYNLDGEYNEKIVKISLVRRFIKKQYWGITSHQQDGWNLIFEFSSSPQYGYVSVRSLL